MPHQSVPLGAPAVAALAETLRGLKAADPLAPVTVVVPSNYAGLSLRRSLGFGDLAAGAPAGPGLVNVRFLVLLRVAEFLGAPVLAAQGRRPLTPVVFAELVRQVLAAAPGRFAPVTGHPATVQSLVRTFQDLRRADPDGLTAIAAGGGERAREVFELFTAFRERCSGAYYDEQDLAAAAAEAVAGGASALRDIGQVVLYLQAELSPAERSLAAALDARGLLTQLDPDGATPDYAGVAIVSAPDPEEEMRTALRLALRAAEDGRSLHRAAILYPAAQPYALLAHSVLGAAGVPFNGPGAETLAQSIAGRCLLAALQLHGEEYRRGRVMDWLTSCPIRLREGSAELAPAQRWEVLARQASVVRGSAEWRRRLLAFTANQRAQRVEAEAEGRSEALVAAMAADIAYADAFLAFLDELFTVVRPPTATGWQVHAGWARGVLHRYVGRPESVGHWDDGQRKSYEAVLSALDELEALPAGGDVTHAEFLAALTQQLQAPSGRTGRFGEGIFVGRYRDAIGATFDAVYLVGMNEGLVPGRGADDPLLPDDERPEGVPPRSTRLDDERQAFRGALAAAPRRALLFARADPRGQQARMPSRWLLDAASYLEGRLLATDDLDLLGRRPWFTVVASYQAGLQEPLPMPGAREYDLRSLLHWQGTGASVDQHPRLTAAPAARRGLQAQHARRSPRLTEWDGMVTALKPLVDGRPLSATALQTWAECPLHYFLGNALRLEGTEIPEEILTITPLERGTLIHAVLERFLKWAPPRSTPGQPWSPDERAELRRLAEAACQEAEDRGVTGKRLLWALERAQILRDVEGFLDADEGVRREYGVRPLPDGAELRFGERSEGSVTVNYDLPSGRRVQFRGAIDRLDSSPDGSRLLVLDYKTGSDRPYAEVVKTTVDRGRKLQLVIYGLAAQARYPGAQVEAGYWFVTEARNYRRIGYPVDAERVAAFGQALDTIVSHIDQGVFAARPGGSGFNGKPESCAFCPFDRCCPADRSAQWERKKAAPALAGYLDLLGEH